MGTTLNRHAYQRLIDEDLEWLLKQPRTLERDHIEAIVRISPKREYETLCDLCHEPLAFCRCRTIGRITIDRETETEKFERISELPSPAATAPIAAPQDELVNKVQYRKELVDAVIQLLLERSKWYSEEIFTPWTVAEAKLIHTQFPGAVDRIAADTARSLIDNITKDIQGPPKCKWCGHAGMLNADGICTHHDPVLWAEQHKPK